MTKQQFLSYCLHTYVTPPDYPFDDWMEAALWCVLTTGNYRDCVLKAVNLGDDTDTVAAVAGGLAGAIYGYEGIPKEWRDTLIKRDYIEEMCERAGKAWGA